MNPTRDDLERIARYLAVALGHRPWARHIRYFHNWDAFVAAAHVTRAHTPQLRGLAARGRNHRNRCIWTDANLEPAQHDETLTHELAHCMLPWRHGHTTTWLRLHIDLLATTPTRQLIEPIAAAAATQHGLDWPPQPHPPTREVPMLTAATATAPAPAPTVPTSVADDLTLVVTRPDGTTHSNQSTPEAVAVADDTVWVAAAGHEGTVGSQVCITTLAGLGRDLRLVVRRQPAGADGDAQLSLDDVDGWRFHAIITNIDPDLRSAVQVEADHRNRGGIPQDAIRQLKNHFGFNHAPLSAFQANGLWQQACLAAYNIALWLRHHALPDSFTRVRGKRLRLAFLNVAARIGRHGRRLQLKFARGYRWVDDFAGAAPLPRPPSLRLTSLLRAAHQPVSRPVLPEPAKTAPRPPRHPPPTVDTAAAASTDRPNTALRPPHRPPQHATTPSDQPRPPRCDIRVRAARPLDPPIPPCRISIGWHRGRTLSTAASRFVELAQEFTKPLQERSMASIGLTRPMSAHDPDGGSSPSRWTVTLIRSTRRASTACGWAIVTRLAPSDHEGETMGLGWQIGLVLFLVVINAGFAGSEIALISLRPGQLRRLQQQGSRGRQVVAFAGDPNRFLATIQIGITLAGFLASATAAVTLAQPLVEPLSFLGGAARPVAVVLVTAVLTFIMLVIGELAPKRVAMQRAEGWSLVVARPLMALAVVARPFVWLLGVSTDAMVRIMGGDPDLDRKSITPEELRDTIATGGLYTREERRIIKGALEATNRVLREVMRPRLTVMALRGDTDVEEARRRLVESGHTHAPVYERELDDADRVVSLLDLVSRDGTVTDHARPALPLPESVALIDALRRLQEHREHMAIVVDEYGGVEGIVTVEDLVEELVGEIHDEYDRDVLEAVRHDDGSLTVVGHYPIHDLVDIGVELPSGEYVTIAGLVQTRLQRIAEVGDTITVGDWVVHVDAVRDRAVQRLTISEGDGDVRVQESTVRDDSSLDDGGQGDSRHEDSGQAPQESAGG